MREITLDFGRYRLQWNQGLRESDIHTPFAATSRHPGEDPEALQLLENEIAGEKMRSRFRCYGSVLALAGQMAQDLAWQAEQNARPACRVFATFPLIRYHYEDDGYGSESEYATPVADAKIDFIGETITAIVEDEVFQFKLPWTTWQSFGKEDFRPNERLAPLYVSGRPYCAEVHVQQRLEESLQQGEQRVEPEHRSRPVVREFLWEEDEFEDLFSGRDLGHRRATTIRHPRRR